MNIKFNQIDDIRVFIMDGDKIIGEIFTPSGTMHDKTNGIQICGFDNFVEFWGCGHFGDGKGNAKKDIQLSFNENSIIQHIDVDLGERICARCFYPYNKCQCLDMVKQLNDAAKEIKEHYSADRKHLICKELEKN